MKFLTVNNRRILLMNLLVLEWWIKTKDFCLVLWRVFEKVCL